LAARTWLISFIKPKKLPVDFSNFVSSSKKDDNLFQISSGKCAYKKD
jgi:hypothetical protein